MMALATSRGEAPMVQATTGRKAAGHGAHSTIPWRGCSDAGRFSTVTPVSGSAGDRITPDRN